MAITLLFVPHQVIYLLVSLVAFRFFDIVKPLGIRKLEKLPRGWGVMADDLLAGIYGLIVIQLLIFIVNKSGWNENIF
jgi:phosphatidylglycerophosphatase A